jgi:capsid protein
MNTTDKTIPELEAEEARLYAVVKDADKRKEEAMAEWSPVFRQLNQAKADAMAELRILTRMAQKKEAVK